MEGNAGAGGCRSAVLPAVSAMQRRNPFCGCPQSTPARCMPALRCAGHQPGVELRSERVVFERAGAGVCSRYRCVLCECVIPPFLCEWSGG